MTRISCRGPGWSRSWRWRSGPGSTELVAEQVRPGGPCGGRRAGEDRLPGRRDDRRGGLHRRRAAAARGHGCGIRRDPDTVTLGSHLRSYSWGNVRQLEAVNRQLLAELARRTPLLPGKDVLAFVAIDSMQKRVYGHKKQGARFGHTKIQGKVPAGPRPERADGGDQHAAGRAGDRRDPAARRERRLGPRRGRLRRRGGEHGPRCRVHRADRGPDGLGVLRGEGDRRDRPRRRAVLCHGARWTPRSRPRSRPSPRTPGRPSSIPGRSGTTSCAPGSPTPRSPSGIHVVRVEERPGGHRPAASSAGSAT